MNENNLVGEDGYIDKIKKNRYTLYCHSKEGEILKLFNEDLDKIILQNDYAH